MYNIYIKIEKEIAPYHNWLVSRTVSPEVVGSNPIGVTRERTTLKRSAASKG